MCLGNQVCSNANILSGINELNPIAKRKKIDKENCQPLCITRDQTTLTSINQTSTSIVTRSLDSSATYLVRS